MMMRPWRRCPPDWYRHRPRRPWRSFTTVVLEDGTNLFYAAPGRSLRVCVLVDAVLLTVGGELDRFVAAGAVAGLVTLVWLVAVLRFVGPVPSAMGGGPPGSGPGGAGVREPRRPGPQPPADGLALPVPAESQGTATAATA